MGGLGRAAFAVALLTALLIPLIVLVPYDKELSYGFQRNATATTTAATITAADGLPYTRRTVRFDSHGTTCDAWLYTPLPPSPPSPPPPLPSPHHDSSASAPSSAPSDTAAADDADPNSNSTVSVAAGDADVDISIAAAAAAAAASTPAPSRPLPVVIMAHGLGGQKDMGLHRFADAFARAGLAALVFDYRTFGGSEGRPRHWASPRRHVQDWRAAVQFVKAGGLGPEYDTNKVALWGTSLAGGHVLVAAAQLPPGALKCVISMVPHLDGVEVSKASLRRRGLAGSLRLLAAGAHDAARAAAASLMQRAADLLEPLLLRAAGPPAGATSATAAAPASAAAAIAANSSNAATTPHADGSRGQGGLLAVVIARINSLLAGLTHGSPLLDLLRRAEQLLPPAYVKLVGRPGELALMQLSPGDLQAYFAKHPKEYEGGWRPVALARFSLEASSYRPIAHLPRLPPGLPVLFIAAARDELCPAHLVRHAAGQVPGGGGALLELPCSHFEAYLGEQLAATQAAMLRFAREHLLG